MVVLQTPRLTLRPLEPSDLQDLFERHYTDEYGPCLIYVGSLATADAVVD